MPPRSTTSSHLSKLGEGGYNIVFDLRQLVRAYPSAEYLVDTLDLVTCEFKTQRFASAAELVAAYSDDIVVRDMKHVEERQVAESLARDCFTTLLTSKWNENAPDATRYKRAKVSAYVKSLPEWEMLWTICKRGIYARHAPLDAFTSMHVRQGSTMTLCVRTKGGGVYPVLRRFEGDIGSLRFLREEATLGVLLDVAESILNTLTYFSIYGVFHHHDIKTSNVLWRRNASGSIETRLSDYDTLVNVPDHVALFNVDMSSVTKLYASPMRLTSKVFLDNFDYARAKRAFPMAPEDLTGQEVLDSWLPLVREHARGRRRGNSNLQCDMLDTVLTKNDLYSLGCLIAEFPLQAETARTKRKMQQGVGGFIRDLMCAGPLAVQAFSVADSVAVGKMQSPANSGIMSLSDATMRLVALRKSFTAEELRTVRASAAALADMTSYWESSISGDSAGIFRTRPSLTEITTANRRGSGRR
jgi:hypothetical protein